MTTLYNSDAGHGLGYLAASDQLGRLGDQSAALVQPCRKEKTFYMIRLSKDERGHERWRGTGVDLRPGRITRIGYEDLSAGTIIASLVPGYKRR